MPDSPPTPIKTGSVTLKFVDGSERTLPIHGITPMQIIRLAGEAGIKDWSELAQPTLATIGFVIKIVAEALTFENIQENWTAERVERSFGDISEITKAFNACGRLSALPKVPETKAQPVRQAPYQ